MSCTVLAQFALKIPLNRESEICWLSAIHMSQISKGKSIVQETIGLNPASEKLTAADTIMGILNNSFATIEETSEVWRPSLN
jgi:hypothetical protein